jgi:hypothetical protein
MRGAPATALLACLGFAGAAATAPERFALIIGNNQGAEAVPRLWYAERDAELFSGALVELGDFAADRMVVLRGASLTTVRDALVTLEARVSAAQAAGERAMLLVYFSGHADELGLELGADHLAYGELRAAILRSPAAVKVVIVDACGAGELTQVKGSRVDSSIRFPLPGEDNVEGTAFVASTALGESAQESALLEGSFFTHHLRVALRGAGDADGDGRVTLAEAFRYAASRTTAGTAATQAGPQHPTYALHMSGRGDVVLADLRRAETRLTLPANPHALYFLRGRAGLFEIPGGAAPLTLALPAGEYEVERHAAGQRETGTVALLAGGSADLPSLMPARFAPARSKGGNRPWEVSLSARVENGVLPDFGAGLGGELGLRYALPRFFVRARLAYLQKARPTLGAYAFRSYGVQLAALLPYEFGPLHLEAGMDLGYSWDRQVFRAATLAVSEGTLGALGSASLPFGPARFGLELDGRAHALRIDQSIAIRYTAGLALFAAYPF